MEKSDEVIEGVNQGSHKDLYTWILVFLICYLAYIAAICEKTVACQRLVLQCNKAILRYNLPQKSVFVGALFVRSSWCHLLSLITVCFV
jgi:hypothetical protein